MSKFLSIIKLFFKFNKIMAKVPVFILVFLFLFCRISYCLDSEDERFFVAEQAFSDDFYDAAATLFERFIKEYPQSEKIYQAKLYLAKSCYFKKDYQKSLLLLSELAENDHPVNIADEVFYWLAEVNFQGKNYKKALELSQKVISGYPDSKVYWWSYYMVAASLGKLGQSDKMGKAFDKIIKECENMEIVQDSYSELLDFYYTTNISPEKLISVSKEFITRFKDSKLVPKAMFYIAEAYAANKDTGKAIDNYRLTIELAKNQQIKDQANQALALNLLKLGDKKEALSAIGSIANKELKLYALANYYFKSNEYKIALESIDSFLDKFPSSQLAANVYLVKADILYEMGRVNDSLSVYQKILAASNQSVKDDVIDNAHYGLAWCYLKNGDFKKAIKEFESTIEYTENPIIKISSRIQIADAYQEAGNFDSSLEIYKDILNSYPSTIYADYIQFQIGMAFLKMNELENVHLALRSLKSNYPNSRLISKAQYYLAVAYFSQESYEQAKSLLNDFMSNFPKDDLNAEADYLYAKCFYNDGDYNESLKVFNRIIKKCSDKKIKELAFIDIGNTYMSLSEFDKAKEAWEVFLKKFPNSEHAGLVLLHLGGIYEKDGDCIQAEKYYNDVVKKYPRSMWVQEAWISLGHLYWYKGDINKAHESFEKVQDNDSAITLKSKLYRAKLYSSQGDTDQAFKLYDELIASSQPIRTAALIEKAFLLMEEKDYAKAVTFFQQALDDGLDSAKIRFSLGRCFEKISRNEEATNEYFKAIYGFNETDYRVKSFFRIAKMYERDGSIDSAREIYNKIIELGVDESKIAKEKLEQLRIRGQVTEK
ncbi:MAG: tetratricopeptide repeat protein [Candidatus Omnitrophota bacterium]